MGRQRSIFLIKTDQSLMGTLWVAKGQIFLTKTDQTEDGHTDLNHCCTHILNILLLDLSFNIRLPEQNSREVHVFYPSLVAL